MSRLQTVWGTFWSPTRALARAAEARYLALPLLIWTLSGVATAVVVAPRLDIDSVTNAALDKKGEPMSPHQREEAIASAHKIAIVGQYAGSIVAPTMIALVVSFIFWLGLKVAGGKPGFVPTLAVFSHATLPLAFKSLLTIPSALRSTRIAADAVDKLLPSNLAALMPDRFHGVAESLASCVDLFSLWVVVLLVIGLTGASGMSRLRTAATTGVLWASYVAVFHVALKSLAARGGS